MISEKIMRLYPYEEILVYVRDYAVLLSFSAAHAVDNINKAIANSNVKKILFLFLLKILKMEKLFMS